MTSEQIERERYWAPRVAGIAVLALIALFAGQIFDAGILSDASNDSESLTARDGELGSLLPGAAIRGLGLALLAAPLWFMYTAAERRSEQMSSRFKPLIIIGAIAFAISSVLTTLALDSVASDFVGGTPITGDAGESRAEDLIQGSSLLSVSSAIGAVGTLGIAFSVLYSALYSMRDGVRRRPDHRRAGAGDRLAGLHRVDHLPDQRHADGGRQVARAEARCLGCGNGGPLAGAGIRAGVALGGPAAARSGRAGATRGLRGLGDRGGR